MKIHRLLGSLGALPLVACAQGTPTFASPDTQSAVRDSVVVNVSDGYVSPETARITADGSVVWSNVSTSKIAQIVFPKSVLASLRCHEARPAWYETAEGIRSTPFASDAENTVLPCGNGGKGALLPGEYTYRVFLYEAVGDDGPGQALPPTTVPSATLDGRIVVESPAGS